LLFIFISYKQINSVIIPIIILLHVLYSKWDDSLDPIEAFIFGEGAFKAGSKRQRPVGAGLNVAIYSLIIISCLISWMVDSLWFRIRSLPSSEGWQEASKSTSSWTWRKTRSTIRFAREKRR
jgi:hypothetical protein